MENQTTEPAHGRQCGRLPDLLFITRAYSRREISFEEWLKQTKEWAEAVIDHCRPSDELTLPRTPTAPG
jgi:hypothetical protein